MESTTSSNRLIHEKSPYLLQHARNPVDWYPWGPEAFEKAKKENKPILVSIGYSTCHWCHVMERESYEDPKVAALMNHALVNIKVDREERPDVDKIYMTAVSAMTGSGGWPLNVFLTPDLKPFFGGTYFPPTARWGQPAWTDVVRQVSDAWADPEQRAKIVEAGDHMAGALKQMTGVQPPAAEGSPKWLDALYASLKNSFDADRGGFSPAPKFPMPVYQNFLLRYYARTNEKPALEMTLSTLRAMADGGIYDHLGGGFARYSTDVDWRIPHFEKMLYDNAQLAVNYLEAYQLTRDPFFVQIARETLGYVERDMARPGGGFYSAEDADSLPSEAATEKTEGAFYIWDAAEVRQLLGSSEADVFSFRYGVRPQGNAPADPHGEFKNKNVLYIAHPIAETARHFNKSVPDTEALLRSAKQKLFEARSKRPRPHLDDKILAGWNGLMISSFAKGAQVLGEPTYLESAERSARFIQENLYDAPTRTLYRRWRDGERKVPGIADDYAFMAQGLLDLYEADFDARWIEWAKALTDESLERFYDRDNGGFFMTSVRDSHDLLVRVKDDADNVEPSASSISALNLLRLHALTDDERYRKAAEKTIRAFGGALEKMPRAMPQMLVALDWSLREPKQIVIAGEPNSPDTKLLLERLHNHFLPVKTVLLLDKTSRAALSKNLDFVSGMKTIDGKSTAYVCLHHTCKAPTTDPDTFEKLIQQ